MKGTPPGGARGGCGLAAQAAAAAADDDDDDPKLREDRCIEQRKTLHNLLRICYRRNSALVLDHVDSVVTTLVSRQPIDSISGEQAEGALRYVFELGEAVRFDAARLGAPTVANTSLTEAQRVARLVNAILESSVITHSSSIAHIALFELYDRYYAYFIANRHHVPTLLQQFLTSSSGIRHPDARVRSRACYLF